MLIVVAVAMLRAAMLVLVAVLMVIATLHLQDAEAANSDKRGKGYSSGHPMPGILLSEGFFSLDLVNLVYNNNRN
jgi:hypothetical protein